MSEELHDKIMELYHRATKLYFIRNTYTQKGYIRWSLKSIKRIDRAFENELKKII